VQRDRNFRHYQDLEARYDLRPSAWVEPKGAWGGGRVELVEIPTDDEVNDNIATYWIPERPSVPGAPATYAYDLHFFGDEPGRPRGVALSLRASTAAMTPGASSSTSRGPSSRRCHPRRCSRAW